MRKLRYGDIDLGIVGYDMFVELGQDDPDLIVVHEALNFGKCHLALGVPSGGKFASVHNLDQLRAMPWTEDQPLRVVTGKHLLLVCKQRIHMQQHRPRRRRRRVCCVVFPIFPASSARPFPPRLHVLPRRSLVLITIIVSATYTHLFPHPDRHHKNHPPSAPTQCSLLNKLRNSSLLPNPSPNHHLYYYHHYYHHPKTTPGYQSIAAKYFADKGFKHVALLSADGALEAAPAMGSADIILDLVSTGEQQRQEETEEDNIRYKKTEKRKETKKRKRLCDKADAPTGHCTCPHGVPALDG